MLYFPQELTLEFPNIVNPRRNAELKVGAVGGGWGVRCLAGCGWLAGWAGGCHACRQAGEMCSPVCGWLVEQSSAGVQHCVHMTRDGSES